MIIIDEAGLWPVRHYTISKHADSFDGLRALFGLWEIPNETSNFAGNNDDLDEDGGE